MLSIWFGGVLRGAPRQHETLIHELLEEQLNLASLHPAYNGSDPRATASLDGNFGSVPHVLSCDIAAISE